MPDHSAALFKAIDERRQDLVELTAELIRFPTINPPGEAYAACAEFLGRRLAKSGFEVRYVRGEGAPGDSDRYPRTNVIARREGRGPRPDRALQFAYRRRSGRWRLERRAVCRRRVRRQGLRPRQLRHEGRPRRFGDRRRRLDRRQSRVSTVPSKFQARSTRNPAASAASPILPARDFSPNPASITSSSPSR